MVMIVSLSGCAFLGGDNSMVFSCPQLDQYSKSYARIAVVEDLFGDEANLDRGIRPRSDPQDPLVMIIRAKMSDGRVKPLGKTPYTMLLLSGGGQWGAYGAGVMNGLSQKEKMPEPDVITGVSTGSIQSLFVAAGQYEQLRTLYHDTPQKDLINHGGFVSVLAKGSVSTYEPLRAKLLNRLCPDRDCAMLKAIARRNQDLLIGIVEANSGDFKVVNVGKLIRDAVANAQHDDSALPIAAQCVTATVIASSAVPIFDQRIKIRQSQGTASAEHAYFDGGVRHSVFEGYVSEVVQAEDRLGTEWKLYVVRNGPTHVMRDAKIDSDANPYHTALRAYQIIVNESEVMSIAALRLSRPTGPIDFTTANGFDKPDRCVKKTDQPFEQLFMQCLVRYGEARAQDPNGPWRPLGVPHQ
jgi:predicted acylesterase/phospholipase RssA